MSVPAISPQNTPQTPAKPERKLKITRVVRAAIDLMVWHGLKRDEAAKQAGMKDNSLYVALRRPDVKAYYLAECEVLRTSGKARRIRRLEEIVEQDDNKQAVVNAVRALELMGEDGDQAAARANSLPGLQIVLIQQASAEPAPIDVPHAVLTHD